MQMEANGTAQTMANYTMEICYTQEKAADIFFVTQEPNGAITDKYELHTGCSENEHGCLCIGGNGDVERLTIGQRGSGLYVDSSARSDFSGQGCSTRTKDDEELKAIDTPPTNPKTMWLMVRISRMTGDLKDVLHRLRMFARLSIN